MMIMVHWSPCRRSRQTQKLPDLGPLVNYFVIPLKKGIQSRLVGRTSNVDWTPDLSRVESRDVRSGVTKNITSLLKDEIGIILKNSSNLQ